MAQKAAMWMLWMIKSTHNGLCINVCCDRWLQLVVVGVMGVCPPKLATVIK